MAELTLYGLKNCDTCRKAQKALEEAGREVVFTDIRGETDLAGKVPVWLATAGAEALVNRRSTTWRGLGEDERAAADGDAGALTALLVANPALVKRPVIEADGKVYVGWSKDVAMALT